MEFHPLISGEVLPEVYHFGFNGTHFEIYLNPTYWFKFLEFAGSGTPFALAQEKEYVPPSILCRPFGQRGVATVSHTLEGFVCLEVPAFVKEQGEEKQAILMWELGHTISTILYVLENLLYSASERDWVVEGPWRAQLFVLETFIAINPEQHFHSAGLGLSLSPTARKYFEGMGDDVALAGAVEAMEDHYRKLYPSGNKIKLFRGAIRAGIRQHGVLGITTVGDCACIGAMPEQFGENRGCYLHSHNVDTVAQQLNLLVGIAYIWQMVRSGVLSESK